jgi:flagellar biosynthesis protein FlhG
MIEMETTNSAAGRRLNSPHSARSGARGVSGSSRMAPVFAIASGKGGVGKTNVAANLAAALARRRRRVLAIDADMGLANLDLLFGVKPAYTLADFFSGRAALDEIITTTAQGVLFLPGVSGVQELTSLSAGQKLALASGLENAAGRVDIVIVDTSSGISDATTYFAAAAQEIVVVVTPEPTSLTDAYALIKVLARDHGQKRFRILANNVVDAEQARGLFGGLSGAAVRFLNVSLSYLGWIPNDPALLAAVLHSRLVVDEAKTSPSAQAFGAVADELIGIAAAGVRVKGNLQFFFRQVMEGMEGAR